MKNIFINFSIIIILVIIVSPTSVNGQTVSDMNQLKINNDSGTDQYYCTQDETEVLETVEHFLFAAGNYNLEAMARMMTDHANVGSVRLKDGESVITTMTIQNYFDDVKKRTTRPYFEPVKEYTIHLNDDHMAFVRADATLYAFGVPKSHNMDYFTLMKDGESWKFISLSYSATPIPEDEKIFDLNMFGKNYAQAWCSQKPEFVSLFFAEDGSLSVNDGKPAVGRNEISKVAESFMTAFPDIIVSMDSLVTTPKGTEFHWTFTGTNTGPNGTGKKVRISGIELWQFDDNGLIKESKGRFDTEEYKKQVKYGVEN
ncbi:MAG: ester cyclase [Ignavibacteriaceae bacterium]|nr:ester cyclase [Ignavibacteriaceae bacterium]